MLKKYFFFPVLIISLILAADICVYFVYPNVSSLKKAHMKETAFMKYREKQWEKDGVDKKIIHKWVPLKKISPYLVKAVIIAEDDKFWRHEGFDIPAMQKAFEEDLKKKKFKAGGSTITQQLAKNLYLSPSKNPVRKLKEAILAWRMERALSKKRIVELYLNAAEWGDGIFGIQAAARHYYKKNASALTAEEAARLASVLPNPIRYKPTGKKRYVLSRSKMIYRIMVQRGIVIPDYEEVIHAPDETGLAESEGVLGDDLIGEADTSGLMPPSGEAQAGMASSLGEQTNTSGPAAPAENEVSGNPDAVTSGDSGNPSSQDSAAEMAGGQADKTP